MDTRDIEEQIEEYARAQRIQDNKIWDDKNKNKKMVTNYARVNRI